MARFALKFPFQFLKFSIKISKYWSGNFKTKCDEIQIFINILRITLIYIQQWQSRMVSGKNGWYDCSNLQSILHTIVFHLLRNKIGMSKLRLKCLSRIIYNKNYT